MAAIRIYRQLQELKDVDPNGLPDQGVPQYETSVSSFVVQTNAGGGSFSLGASNLGNTLGDTGVTGTRVVLAGVGNLTLSQSTDANGGTISISGGTAGAGFSAGVSGGNTAGDTGITGTRLVLAGGNNVTLSQATDANGGTVTVVGPVTVAQTVQTQGLFDLTLDGNTAGALALVSSGTLTLAGGNSITLSQNGNAITISGASTSQSVQTQPIQTGISSIVASNATYTSGSVQFTGSGIVTIRSSANQRVVVDASQSVQTQNMVDVTISGNTAGAGALVSSGTLTLAGGSNITLSQNGNAISIIGNAAGTETQIAISGIANSQTTFTSGTVGLSELGAITIRSTTGNQFQLSVNPQSVQPETQTFVGGIAASDTTYTSGTVRLTGVGGGVTVSSNTGQRVDISVAAQSAESQSIGMSNIGNTSGTTGIASGAQVRMLFAGGNSITLSQSLNGASGTITISGPSISESIGMSNLGNTSGTTGIASGPQVRFLIAGGNNITLSQSLNGASGTLTISGPNAQTGISGLANSQTTYTSGTVSLSELGAITIRSTTGNQFQFSVNSQTVQTQNMVAVTLSGNTSGAQALISSGTLTLAGGNNITVSQAGNAVTISGPNVGGAQTGISGIIGSDATYTSGTVQFTGSNMITVKSSAGQRIVIDATQSVQPETQTFIGGIANTETTYTSGTVKLLELGAITVRSTTGNQFQLSVNAQTGTQFSAGISGGNTAGDTGTVAGRVVLAGGNNITLSGSTNGASETISIVGGAGGAFSGGVSNVGNSSGDTGITGSRLVFAGGNSITLSQSTNASGGTITVSAPNASVLSAVAPLSTSTNGSTISILGPAQLSVGFSTAGNTAGDTGFVTGRLALVGSNGITLSGSTNAGSQTITISGVTQSAESQSFGMSNIGNTSGTTGIASGAQVRFLLAGGNNVTLSQSLNGASGTITVSAASQSAESQSIGMSNIGNTSGTTGIASGAQVRMLFAGGNNITLSQSLNGASGTITISAPNQSAQTGISGIANSQTTYTSGTVSMSELGAITIRSTTGNQYQFSVNAQTGTQFSAGLSNLGNTSGDTVTVGGRLILAGSNGITLSGSSNGASQTITISGITQSVESQSIGMSNIGNTSGTTGIASGGQVRFLFAGGNNITLSQSLNGASGTITISAPNLGAGAMSVGLSNLGNTAGSTGATGTRLVLVASGNLSGSQSTDANGGTITFNDTVSAFQAGVSTGGNTAGDTGVTGTRLVLVGSSPISLSQATGANGGTISINAPATSSLVGTNGISVSTNGSTISISVDDDLADWENMPRAQASLISHVSAFSKTPIYWNDHIDGGILAKSLAFAISMVTASQPLSVSVHLGIYTLANSTSANRLGSVSEAYVVSSASSVSLSGVRNVVMTGIGTHTALSSLSNGEYMLGMMFSATATNAMNFSLLGASGGAGALGGIFPGTNALSTGTSQGIQVLAGRGSTTVNAMPANVSAADLVNQGQGASMPLHPWIYIRS